MWPSTRSRPAPTTTRVSFGAKLLTWVKTWLMIVFPAKVCKTFGVVDFMRVPSPAARTIATSSWCSKVSPPPYLGMSLLLTFLAIAPPPFN